jgi:hypothetical protein
VAQQRPLSQGRDIHAVITSDQAAYHVGDTVRLQIALTNVSDGSIGFLGLPPWAQVVLVIRRSGAAVPATAEPWGIAGAGVSSFTRLDAHKTVVWGWDQKFEWNPLEAWGFHIHDPGTYTIEGIPQITAPRGVVEDLTTVRSNVVTISVTPR